jgi:hypothetical protein
MKTYIPSPIDTNSIKLSESLNNLIETLARNVHENWAKQRILQGWTYGPERSDHKKQHPCLVPFEALSEEEKLFDRKTAIETIKLIFHLGYKIDKKKSSELFIKS